MKVIRLNNFQDAEEALRPYVPLVSELTGKDTVFDRIIPLMESLGNPHQRLKTIHLAGTSGKTSTSYYIDALLLASGHSVGLTVSPHIDQLSERAQINGQPLKEAEFCHELSEFLGLVEVSGIKPSYFELMYAFSIWLFAKRQVDYAVIETGMGGLFDATNIVDRADKVCVITDIGFDHMHILGDTIAKITAQKVGIVHPGNNLLMYEQADEVMNVVRDWVTTRSAALKTTSQDEEQEHYGKGEAFNQMPDYQKRNWLLAYYAYRFIAERDNLKQLSESEVQTTQRLTVPARMDEVVIGSKRLVMDGAHNYQKMEAFISSFKHKYPNQKPAVLLAFKTGKDFLPVLQMFKDFAAQIIITTFNTSQDLPAKACDPEEVAQGLDAAGFSNYQIEPDLHRAYSLLLNSDAQSLVITGSFYLIAQLRQKDIKID